MKLFKIYTFTLTVSLLILTGCENIGFLDKSTISPIESSPAPSPAFESIPAFEGEEKVILPLPDEINLNANPLNLPFSYLHNCNVCFSENFEEMYSNNYENFNLDNITLTKSNDAIILTGNGSTPSMTLNKYLDEYISGEEYANQGILLRFRQIDAKEVYIYASGDIFGLFWGDHPSVQNHPINIETPCGIRVDNDKWYYVFKTQDDLSNQRIIVWEEGKAEQYSCWKYRNILDHIDYKHIENQRNQRIEFIITLGDDENFAISDYWIIEYEELSK